MAEREIVKLCRAKSTRLGLSESKVVISEFRLLSCALMRGLASMILNRDLHCDQSRLKLLRVCKQNPIFACLPIHDMSLIFTAAALLSASGASSASNINLLCPASPSGQNFVCLVRSRLRCHVRRHRHARNKGKFGSYAFLHATPSDYLRSHCVE